MGLLAKLVSGEDQKALELLGQVQKTNEAKDIQIKQLQAELERIRNSEGGSSFNDLVQRMMFKCGVTRIGPLTNDELVNEIDAAFAASAAGGSMDRKTFHEIVNSKKMMELRLRKLIAEIQADYWLESKSPYGMEGEEVAGRDLASHHTAAKALSHLLIRSQEELHEEIQRVKTLSSKPRVG